MVLSKSMRDEYEWLVEKRDEALGKNFEEWMYGSHEEYEKVIKRRRTLFGDERTEALIDRMRRTYIMNRSGRVGTHANMNTLRALQRRGMIEIEKDADMAMVLGTTVVRIV